MIQSFLAEIVIVIANFLVLTANIVKFLTSDVLEHKWRASLMTILSLYE